MLNLNNRLKVRKRSMLQGVAKIKGNKNFPNLKGTIRFFEKGNGTIIRLELNGLPNINKNNFFGLHIHEFGICGGANEEESFLEAGSHFDLEENKHPNHTGDLPSIYSNNGYSYMEFFTNRFCVSDVIGKSVIIHKMHDDFVSEPSGNSGSRIACGVIEKYII